MLLVSSASEANSAYDAYAYDEIEWNNFIIIYKATPWIMKLHYFIISVHHSFCVSCLKAFALLIICYSLKAAKVKM